MKHMDNEKITAWGLLAATQVVSPAAADAMLQIVLQDFRIERPFRGCRRAACPNRTLRAWRRLVEVAGVEPASETALAKLLRAYCTFDLVAGMPMPGLIRRHASDCTACGVQTSNPARGPAE